MNLKYNTYHTFEFGGNYYLFDNETLISCIIDERVYDALNNNDVSFLTENEIQMLELFHERGIFFVDSPQVLYNVYWINRKTA